MRKIHFILPIVLALFVFVACKKGDTGPAGPAGADGPAGPAGPAGADGPAGTANVIYSDWLEVIFDEDTATNSWNAIIPAPGLTADILNSGDVKVYFNLGSTADPVVFPIPYFDGQTIVTPVFVTDSIVLSSTDDVSTKLDSASNEKFLFYRYVLIPGGEQAYSGVDFKNYLSVRQKFDMKD
ncbi:MAG TPA: hypothetical protein VK628_05115 [Flavitalea sp.]|nr:hypothetical protein [Flavitalea sp.]